MSSAFAAGIWQLVLDTPLRKLQAQRYISVSTTTIDKKVPCRQQRYNCQGRSIQDSSCCRTVVLKANPTRCPLSAPQLPANAKAQRRGRAQSVLEGYLRGSQSLRPLESTALAADLSPANHARSDHAGAEGSSRASPSCHSQLLRCRQQGPHRPSVPPVTNRSAPSTSCAEIVRRGTSSPSGAPSRRLTHAKITANPVPRASVTAPSKGSSCARKPTGTNSRQTATPSPQRDAHRPQTGRSRPRVFPFLALWPKVICATLPPPPDRDSLPFTLRSWPQQGNARL